MGRESDEGTHNPRGGSFRLVDQHGRSHEYELAPCSTPADVQGFGYYGRWHDRENPGTCGGDDLVTEADDYESDPGVARGGSPHIPPAKRVGPTEFPCPLTGPDGATGVKDRSGTLELRVRR